MSNLFNRRHARLPKTPLIVTQLTHWGRMTHICVSKLASIISDNGLSPGRRQAIIWNNAGILLIGPLGTNFSEILIEIHIFSSMKMHFEMSSDKMAAILSRPQCVNVKPTLKDEQNDPHLHYTFYFCFVLFLKSSRHWPNEQASLLV